MDPLIEPDDWDVIVIGSGLPQCLIASAIAKAGKSVVLIDQEDTYGCEYASFTLEALRQAALGVQNVSLTSEPVQGSGQPTATDPHPVPDASPSRHAIPSSSLNVVRMAFPAFSLPLEDVQGWCVPEAQALTLERGYILDLMPRLIYQAEPLVDLLVKCRAHHYLEFKRVEGSYILTPGTPSPSRPSPSSTAPSSSAQHPAPPSASSTSSALLRAVPASRSDIFKDRSLSLSDKRSLMSFLSAAVEAVQGEGKLKDLLAGDTPLASVLQSQGVPHHLQHIILHGIAMCDAAQEQAGGRSSVAESGGAAREAGPRENELQGPEPVPSPVTEVLTARQGAASLQLLMQSMARYGGPGAFMVPSWGCGALPEAFVRCCAVNGGTTVLRCRVEALLLAPADASEQLAGREPPSPPEATDTHTVSPSLTDGPAAPMSQSLPEAKARPGHPGAGGAGCTAGAAWRVTGVVTAGGQELRCKHVVMGAHACRALVQELSEKGTGPPTGSVNDSLSDKDAGGADGPATRNAAPAAAATAPTAAAAAVPNPCAKHPVPAPPILRPSVPAVARVCRALVIMDSSLVPGQNNLTLFIPPLSPVLEACNRHAVRAVQFGPTLSTSPASRYLLYLSTPADEEDAILPSSVKSRSDADKWQALQGAVQALVQTCDLQPLVRTDDQLSVASVASPHQHQDADSVLPDPVDSGAQDHCREAAPELEEVKEQQASTQPLPSEVEQQHRLADTRPRALQVFYYAQRLRGVPEPRLLPVNAVCPDVPCGTSALGLVGHTAATSAAEAAFKAHFPDLLWLSELDDGTGAKEEGYDDDIDAIDDLQSALGNLAPGKG